MIEAFLSILKLSITASLVAVVVMLLRLGMKKAPKWISAALWAFVGARLVFPFALQSPFSLIPSIDTVTTTYGHSAGTIQIHSDIGLVNYAVNEHIAPNKNITATISALDVISVVWIVGFVVFLLYGIISYLCVYRKVCTAIPMTGNIYQSENIQSPFVIGFFKPRIIVPFNLDEETLHNVIMHENAHLKRKDHIVKPFAYLLVCFHWFNPVIWLSYILLCRDIEVACDEKVIKKLSFSERKNYALALLNCKVKNTTVAVCPVAFGEVNVKSRIKNTLYYKKPAMGIIVAAIVVAVIASGCLLTNPKAESYIIQTSPPVENVYPTEVVTEPATEKSTEEVLAQITTSALLTEVATTEKATEAETQAEYIYEYYQEEVYEEPDYYEEETEVKPIISFEEYWQQKQEEEMQKLEESRIQRLLSSTSNHSDTCPCSDCDVLRDKGYYPLLVEIPEDLPHFEDYYSTEPYTVVSGYFESSVY